MPSLLQLQDLYQEALVREVVEKTKACGLTWVHTGGTSFSATEIQDKPAPTPDVTWTFFITKTQVGNVTFKYILDIKRDAQPYVSIEDGPLGHSGRESVVKELYEIVEIIVLELDSKLKDAIQFVQSVQDCRS